MSGRPPLSVSEPDESNLRALKLWAVFLPVLAVVVGELVRATLIDPSFGRDFEHLVSGGLAIVAVLAFTGLMLAGIQRAQRSLVRQNRDLRLATAASTALQDDESMDVVIQRTIATIVEATEAAEASVAILADDDSGGGAPRVARTIHAASTSLQPARMGSPIVIPLWNGPSNVGQLTIVPALGTHADAVDEGVLGLIGHQLACAIQMRQVLADLRRRRSESGALYDVALQVTNRLPLVQILASIRNHAHDLLDVDEAALCLTAATSAALRQAKLLESPVRSGDGVICFCSNSDGPAVDLHAEDPSCPVRDSPAWLMKTSAPLRSSDAELGELWVGRTRSEPLDDMDHELLAGLADLAAIAIVSANLRQRDEMAAIVAERERIAREMHDSLAQVLATVHLRLCALERRPAVYDHDELAQEVGELGEMTHEAYIDVREAILGLRESSHADRELLACLRIYLEKFSTQTGLAGRLETALPDDLGLAPGAEIQVIRVIQEALTNVRKHAGASSAVVRVEADGDGVCLVVEDDGRGFDPVEVGGRDDGFGLHAMRERMSLVGGTLTIQSAPGTGTRVTARLPHQARSGKTSEKHVRVEHAESYAHLAG